MALSLAALAPGALQTIQAPDPAKKYHILQDARAGMQQETLRNQQIESNAANQQAQQKALKDAAAIHDILAQGFDETGNVRPEAIQAITAINPEFGRGLLKDQQAQKQATATGLRNEALQNAKALEGEPGQEFGTTGMAPQYQAPLPTLNNPDILEQQPAATVSEGQRVVGPSEHAPIDVPSAFGGPFVRLRPQTRAGLQNQAEADRQKKVADQIAVDRAKQKAEFDYNTANRATPAVNNDTVTTAQGIMQFNPQTNRYDIKVGDRPPQQGPAGGEPLESVIGEDGQAILVPRSQAAGRRPAPSSQNRPPSEGERTALRFYERMKGAAEDLDRLEPWVKSLGTGGQARLSLAPNILQSNEGQLYTQAQRAFTEARLRKDSGAAIPEQEFANDRRMYFPQPGDIPEAIAQKAKSRKTAIGAISRSAGRAYEETYGEPPPKLGGAHVDIDSILNKVFGKPK